MKILMLTPYLPYPPSSGGQVRSYNLIKHLSKRHKLYLVSLIKNSEEKRYVKNLLPYCKEIHVCKRSESPWTASNILSSIFGIYPFLVVRNYSLEAQNLIDRLLKENDFDLIHAETFYIMPHIPKTKTPVLLVEQTIEYKVYQHFVNQLRFAFMRPFFYFDIIKLKHWEKTFWKKADLVGAVSVDDERDMKKLVPELDTITIPNAAGEDLMSMYDSSLTKAHPIFLYQGNFSWLQNVEAANILVNKIFPKIKDKIPNATCIIAGQRALEKLGNINQHGIKVVDIMSSDTDAVLAVYKQASIFLAPIEGPGGTRLKILGAMAAGLPVISSPTGVRGLDIENNVNVLIAKNDRDFADKAVMLLQDDKKYRSVRKNARALIESNYSWDRIAEKLEQIYLKLIKHEKSS